MLFFLSFKSAFSLYTAMLENASSLGDVYVVLKNFTITIFVGASVERSNRLLFGYRNGCCCHFGRYFGSSS